MGKKDKKKKGPSQSKASSIAEEDPFDLVVDDNGELRKQDYPIIARLITSNSKHLGRISAEFLEAFKGRCQLSIGSALVLLFEFLSSADKRQEKRLVQSRIILLYLVYKVRELEPWLKRKTEKNKENMLGHIFMEFFLRLAADDHNNVKFPGLKLVPTVFERHMARMILGRKGIELQTLTANDICYNYSKPSFLSPQPEAYDNLTLVFENQLQRWLKDLQANGIPGIIFPSGTLMEAEPETKILPTELDSEELIILIETLFEVDLVTVPTTLETRAPSFAIPGRATWERDSPLSQQLAAVLKEVQKDIRGPSSKPTVSCSKPEMNAGQQPQSSSSSGSSEKGKSPLYETIIQRMLNREAITQNHFICAFDYVHLVPDTDKFFDEIAEVPPAAFNPYIEFHVRFFSELIYRIVKMENSKIYIHLLSMMELGFSVQCVEIVLRLYRNIANLPIDVLLEYFDALMAICDSTTSSSQKARYVRIFSSFVITILNEGILHTQINDNTKNCLTEIQAFALRNNEHREATGLFQKLQEFLRKWIAS